MSFFANGMPCNILTKGLGESCEAEEDICLETILPLTNIVTTTHDYTPLTGVYSIDDNIDGWLWDRRFIEEYNVPASRYMETIGGHSFGLKEGTKRMFWNSGTIQGTEFLSITGHRVKGEFLSWTPKVSSGKYSVLFEPKNLYSDFSSTSKIDPLLLEDGVNYFDIPDDCRKDTISVVLYKRDELFVNWPWNNYEFANSFRGKMDGSGNRLPTEDDSGNIIWQNVSDRHMQYVLRNDRIYLDRKSSIVVGNLPTVLSADTIRCNLENKGPGNSSGRDCFSEYFPIMNDSVFVYTVKGNSYKEWKQVESLKFSTEDDLHFMVDHDLGIITMGGYKAPDLILREPLGLLDTEITFYPNDSIAKSFPDQGILTIGDEKILFYSKGKNRFYECIRGYQGTIPAEHKIGSAISDVQHGKAVDKFEDIYISYVATPRVEYEITDHNERSANAAPFVDLKAISNVNTNKIFQISPIETHVSTITLECDAPRIAGRRHGPLYYGTDWTKLTARITNSSEMPVSGIDVTIHLDGPGGLNGNYKEFTNLSNTLGEVYAFYNCPYDWESIRKEVIKIWHDDGDTYMNAVNIPPGIDPKQSVVFQVLKHDKFYGTQGDKLEVISFSTDPETITMGNENIPYGHSSIIVDALFEDVSSQWSSKQTLFSPEHELDANLDTQMYKNGIGEIIGQDPGAGDCAKTVRGKAFLDIMYVNKDTGGVTWRQRQIRDAVEWWESDCDPDCGEPLRKGTKFLLAKSLKPLPPEWEMKYVWAVEKDASYWSKYYKSGKFLDGVPVIVYEWNNKALHPVTGEIGAYAPLWPDILNPGQAIFKDKTLSIPKPYDKDNNLGGYYLVCGDVVSLYATCVDPISGKVLISNTIEIELRLPSYLDGVDKSGILPIPYGFGFVSEEFNVGTGIGGGNFLTINPVADGVPSFSLNLNNLG
tara:strand:- start:1099 stop:3888 length:2790 start_codon:yes stop_codon:yes gene_type:complete